MKRPAAALVALSLALVPLMVVLPAASASADSVVPSPSDFAINVPGSVLSGAAKGVSVYSEAQVGAVLANKMKYAWDWSTDALASRLSGNSTISPPPTSGLSPAEVSRLDQIQAGFKGVPSTVFKTATKVVGGAVTGFFVAQSGLALGPVINSAFGLDDTAALCGGGDGSSISHLIAGVTGLDCDKWTMSEQLKTLMNKDALGGVAVGSWTCDGTFCAKYVGPGVGGYTTSSCFQTKGAFPPNSILHWRYADTATFGTQSDGASAGSNLGWYMCSNQAADYSAYWWGGYMSTTRTIGSYWIEDGAGAPASAVGSVTTSSSDPVRQFRCDVTSTTGSVLSQLSPQFFESGQQAKPVCPAIPAGWIPAETHQWQVVAGQPDIDMGIVPTTPEYQSWKTNFPECANGSCLLDLKKAGVSCLSVPGPCADWMKDPARDTNYQCRYGMHDMALSECYVYAPTFDPAKIATGHAYADPATGVTPSEATTLPVGDTGPGSAESPCFPTGWGVVNPFEWVLKPALCALKSAFIPSTGSVTEFQTKTQTALDNSAFPVVRSSLTAVGAAFLQGSTGCDGPSWAVNMTLFGGSAHQVYHPLSACTGTMNNFASTVRNIGSVFVSLFALLACIRYIAAIFGYVGFSNGRADSAKVSFKGGESA